MRAIVILLALLAMAGSDGNGQDPDTFCSDCGNKLDKNGNGHDPTCEWA